MTLSFTTDPREQVEEAPSGPEHPGPERLGPEHRSPGSAARRRPTAARRRPTAEVRRHRIIGALVVAAVVLAVGAMVTGLTAAWAAAGFLIASAGGYGLLVTWLTRRAGRQEVISAFAGANPASPPAPIIDWAQFDKELRLSDDGGAPLEVTSTPELSVATVARFACAYLAAWVLTPVVVAIRLAGGDLSDLERHDVIGRIIRFQQYGRSRSLQVLTASVAATAGVAVLGSSASVALATSAAAASASYTVQAGDTLSSIASSYGTTVAALAAANSLSNPDVIYAGQVLSLTGSTSAPAGTTAPGGGATYTVQSGDTLGSIAAAHGTTVASLAAVNSLANPNLIYPGQVLSLGGGAGSGGPVASPSPSSTSGAGSSSGSYTVSSGDTLAAIAAKEGTTVSALVAANELANPNLIYPGQVLQLSGGSAPAPSTPSAVPAATPAPAETVSAPTSSSAAAQAVAVALAQVGKPYLYGGAGPNSYDCSGLVMYAWAAAGVSLPHYTVSQYGDTARVAESDLQPGDLVFYDNDSGAQPGHVALYIGNGQVVSANTSGTNVQTQSITYDGTPMGFGRVS